MLKWPKLFPAETHFIPKAPCQRKIGTHYQDLNGTNIYKAKNLDLKIFKHLWASTCQRFNLVEKHPAFPAVGTMVGTMTSFKTTRKKGPGAILG